MKILKSRGMRVAGVALLLFLEQILLGLLSDGIQTEEKAIVSFLCFWIAVLLVYALKYAGYKEGYEGICQSDLDTEPYDLVSAWIIFFLIITIRMDDSLFLPSALILVWTMTTAVQIKAGTVWTGTMLNRILKTILKKNDCSAEKRFSRIRNRRCI